ncbi:MAG TPA: DmsE family decaheme c-type cytochrome [Burkholderiales bacterium]|nr:DmsE family decaheme c-type cytochrome [Burkholderiales bacterium]
MGCPQIALRAGLAALLALLAFGVTPALAQEPGPEVCKACHADKVASFFASKHGVRTDSRTPISNGGCVVCHANAAEHVKAGGGKGAGGIVNPGRSNHAISAEAKNAICLACHQGGQRIHWDRSAHANNEVACTNCHMIHTAHDDVRDKLTQSDVCFSCHRDKRAGFNLPYRHPIKEGKVACSDCHNAHGSAGEHMLVRDSVNDTCYQCHMEMRGPFIRNHEPVQEDCTLCHNPHGTTNPNLLKVRVPFLCQSCHQPTSHHGTIPGAAPVNGGNPAIAQAVIMARGCLNCHTEIHGSNNPTDNSGRAFRH